MRKRLENLSKRCMVAIMSATMLMSSVTVSMALPVGVYADGVIIETDTDENNESAVTIKQGVTLGVNNGNIDCNYGTINTNNSIVNQNFPDGEIQSNNSRVILNRGNVNNSNTGNVRYNFEDGTVTGSGTVTYNCGGTVDDGVNVENMFYYVKAEGFDNATVDFEADRRGFKLNLVLDDVECVRKYARKNCGGTVTMTPDADYEIIGDEVTEAIVEATFRYTISRDDEGVVTVTISDVTGNISLNPGILGLAVQKIMKQENIDSANVVLEDGNDGDDDGKNNDNDNTLDQSQGKDVQKQIIENISKAIADAKNNKLDYAIINFNSNTCMTKEIMEALLNDDGVQKICSFIYKGKPYLLYIPQNVDAAAKQKCFEALEKEPGGFAGFQRIAGLFSSCGLNCLGSVEAPQAEANVASTTQAVSTTSALATTGIATPIVSGTSIDATNTNVLDANTAARLAANNQIPYNVTTMVGGLKFTVEIPAGFDYRKFIRADGSINVPDVIWAVMSKKAER